MAPVVLKIPMNMAIPIFKVVELGPPPETARLPLLAMLATTRSVPPRPSADATRLRALG